MTVMIEEFDATDFKSINAEETPQAERLGEILLGLYDPSTIVDIGCATGLYLQPFHEAGRFVYGIEPALGAAMDAGLKIPRSLIEAKHFPCDINLKPIDLILCFEVAEHLEYDEAIEFVQGLINLSRNSGGKILFSAAQPGQGGKGHVNCQPLDFWEGLFTSQGMIRLTGEEGLIKEELKKGAHMGWLLNNLMVFDYPLNALNLDKFDDTDMTEEQFDDAFNKGIPVEVMVTDPETGGMKASKPAQESMLDPLALSVLAEVAGMGAEKYDDFNYLKGYRWSLSYDSLQRHAKAFWNGEDYDPESGLPHMAHAAWHALALVSFFARELGTDNRPHEVLGWNDES